MLSLVAIWLRPGDEEALALMHRITQRMRETEERKPKEMVQHAMRIFYSSIL